jgi:predicted DNA-binding protein
MEEIMSKKLTISIPDDLHKRLDKYRSRIAISTICAEAINTEIESIDDCLKAIKGRFRLLTQREICSLAYKEGRHWAGYKATLEELAIVSCWRGSDEEEPDWFAKLSEDAKEKIEKETNARTTVEELAINLLSEVVRIRSEEDGFDFYWENHEAAQDFIQGAQEIWWMIEDEAIELLTSSKRRFQGKE